MIWQGYALKICKHYRFLKGFTLTVKKLSPQLVKRKIRHFRLCYRPTDSFFVSRVLKDGQGRKFRYGIFNIDHSEY